MVRETLLGGVEFPDGVVVLRWKMAFPTSVVFHDRGIESVEHVHGHGGKTEIVWLDEIDVAACPECDEKGRYDGRVLVSGRGVYTCPNGHKWQDGNEKPTSKGIKVN